MAWETEFRKDLLDHKVSTGIMNHYRTLVKDSLFHTCADCGLPIGRKTGRPLRYCPNCGTNLSLQDGYPQTALSGIKDYKPSELIDAETLSERLEVWQRLRDVCHEVHAAGRYPMVPWSPNRRVIRLEAVNGGVAVFALYPPVAEFAGRPTAIRVPVQEVSSTAFHSVVKKALSEAVYHAESSTPISKLPLTEQGYLPSEEELYDSVYGPPENPGQGSATASIPVEALERLPADADWFSPDGGVSRIWLKSRSGVVFFWKIGGTWRRQNFDDTKEPAGKHISASTPAVQDIIRHYFGTNESLGSEDGPDGAGAMTGPPVGLGAAPSAAASSARFTEDEQIGHRSYKSAVAIVVKENSVLIGLSTATDDRAGYWCFPGGGIDPEDGGDAGKAAAREAYEETGVSVEPSTPFIEHPEDPGIVFVKCNWLEGEPEPNSEFLELAWMPFGMRHEFPGLFPLNREVLERLSGVLKEGDEDAYRRKQRDKKNVPGTVGGKGAPAPDNVKPGTTIHDPEDPADQTDPDAGEEETHTLTPAGKNTSDQAHTPASTHDKDAIDDEEGGDTPGEDGDSPVPKKLAAKAPNLPTPAVDVNAQPSAVTPPAVAPRQPAPQPQMLAPRLSPQPGQPASEEPPGSEHPPAQPGQAQSQPPGGEEQPQDPNQAQAQGQVPPQNGQPGQPDPNSMMAQGAAPGMAPAGQPVAAGGTGVEFLLPGEVEAEKAERWLQAMGIAQVTRQGSKVSIQVATQDEMMLVRRTASAFGLELSGLG